AVLSALRTGPKMTSMSERPSHDAAHADAEFREQMRRIRRAANILGGAHRHEPAATWEEGIARIRSASAKLSGGRQQREPAATWEEAMARIRAASDRLLGSRP